MSAREKGYKAGGSRGSCCGGGFKDAGGTCSNYWPAVGLPGDQTALDELVDGHSHRSPVHAQVFGQLALGWKPITCFEFAGLYLAAQHVRNTIG